MARVTATSSQTVLITGCSTGIGRALAIEFAKRGQVVYATARRVETIGDLKAQGIRTAALDVNSAASIETLMQRLKQDAASVDVLVNNAGYGAMGPLVDLPADELHQQFETNVFSIVALIQAFAPGMMQRRSGRIVNIGSVSGALATPFSGAYCATKAAVHALSDSLRVELAPFGVKVITVQPGGIRSQFGATAGKGVESRESRASAYARIQDAIAARANASQEKDATPAEDFAREMVDAVMVEEPDAVIRIGHGSFVLPFIKRWMPARILDRVLSKRFRLDQMKE